MARPVPRKELEEGVARDLGLPLTEVRLAVWSQFMGVAETIKEGKARQIRLPLFGRFYVKAARLEARMRSINKAKETRKQNEQ